MPKITDFLQPLSFALFKLALSPKLVRSYFAVADPNLALSGEGEREGGGGGTWNELHK